MLGVASKPTPPPGVGGSGEHTHASTRVSLAPPSLKHGGPLAGSGYRDTGQRYCTTEAAHGSLQASKTLARVDTGPDSLLKSSHPRSVRRCGPTHPKGHRLPVSEQA